jgi:hypothetical protein
MQLNSHYLHVSGKNSTYLSKILPQVEIDAFNNSTKDASALTRLRVAYDIQIWQIIEQHVYPNGEIFEYLSSDETVLPSVKLRYLYGAATSSQDDDAMSIDGEEDEGKAGNDSDDEDVVEWVWDTLECPLSVFKLLELRARVEMSGMLRKYPFLPTHLLLP